MFYKSISENFQDKTILGVLGNHDCLGDLEYYGLTDIHGKSVKSGDLTICGVEWCVRYKKADFPLHTQEEIIDLCSKLGKCDIILSHNSPKGIHDRDDIAHEGYEGLIQYIEKHQPKYCLHGHQHKDIVSEYKGTKVIGVYGGIILNTDTGEITKVLDAESL